MTKSKLKTPRKATTRDERLSFRCPAALRESIEAAAARDQRSVSDWLVLALTKLVQGGR